MKINKQLSLFDIDMPNIITNHSARRVAQLHGLPESRVYLLGADEMRDMQNLTSSTLHGCKEVDDEADNSEVEEEYERVFGPDLMCGFLERRSAFEYVARLYELNAYRYVLEQIMSGQMTEAEGQVEGLLPEIFEDFCSRLALFIWDCWAETTPRSNDKGLDGIIFDKRHGKPIAGIQSKYYSGRLSPNYIREFYGALATSKPPLSYGLLLTTSDNVASEPVKVSGMWVLVRNRECIQALLSLSNILGHWLTMYGEFVARGFPPEDEEWKSVASRIFVVREAMVKVLRIPCDWPLQVRREHGLDEMTIDRWRKEPLSELF